MLLTAAPIVRQPLSLVGAPGKTDFVRIFIASELNNTEYRTVLRHEQAHVWARHNSRKPKDARHDIWQVACEMEIARTIYDEADIANIQAPRSRLAGGYLPGSIEGMPIDITLAEDIYEWLINNPDNLPKGFVSCACEMSGDGEEVDEESATALVSGARENLDAIESQKASQAAVDKAYTDIRNRPPSLTCAVDAALRVRIERERSHRRPTRRSESSDVLMPGAISTPRPPLVEIFVDRSGSFTSAKTAIAERKLRELLARYGSSIRHDVWFFGNGRLTDRDAGGGGDTPYHLIPEHLERTQPKLAVIITDDDPAEKIGRVSKTTKVICIPIGCARTNLAAAIGGLDVEASS